MNYSVQQGDTMYGIAKRYGIAFADLVSLNPHITDPDLIYPGQVMQVPGNEINDPGKTSDPAKILEVAAKLDELVKGLGDLPGVSGKKTAPTGKKPASTKPDYSRGTIPRPQVRMMPGFVPAMMNGYYAGAPSGHYSQPILKNSGVEGKHQRKVEISLLQQGLKELGYYNGPITGRIGTRTKASVKKLQKDFGRPANGVVDSSVWDIIRRK